MPVCLYRLYTPSKGNDMFFSGGVSRQASPPGAKRGRWIFCDDYCYEGGSRRYCSTALEDHESGMMKKSVFCPIDRVHHPSSI